MSLGNSNIFLFQIDFIPTPTKMPRAKQAKTAEPKKRAASTKNLSDEELSPKRAKTLKDSNKTGIQDFCTKSGVQTMLE